MAIIFALKCLGKGRGYIEQPNLRVTAGEEDFSKAEKDAAVAAILATIQFEQEQLTAGDQDANPIIDLEPSKVQITIKD